MRAIEFIFEVDKSKFLLETAVTVVKTFFDKYNIKYASMKSGSERVRSEAVVLDEAGKLFGNGIGGNMTLNVLVFDYTLHAPALPYVELIIEAISKQKQGFSDLPIPEDKVYINMSVESSYLKTNEAFNSFIDDAVRLYLALKPNYGVGDAEDWFSYAQVPTWGNRIFSAMFLSPTKVDAIGPARMKSLKSEVYQVRKLGDGGVFVWLRKGSPEDQNPILPGSPNLEDRVCKILGLKGRTEK